eukprot:Skav232802  [mRNA]  locus=scaffold614:365865:366199:- [translate_table: standard]
MRFCFGKIKYKGQESPSTWVVLGLLVERGLVVLGLFISDLELKRLSGKWSMPDADRDPRDLTFSEAERMNSLW